MFSDSCKEWAVLLMCAHVTEQWYKNNRDGDNKKGRKERKKNVWETTLSFCDNSPR